MEVLVSRPDYKFIDINKIPDFESFIREHKTFNEILDLLRDDYHIVKYDGHDFGTFIIDAYANFYDGNWSDPNRLDRDDIINSAIVMFFNEDGVITDWELN